MEDKNSEEFDAFEVPEQKRESEDESIYNEEVVEQLLEDDELSSLEAAFMRGYDDALGESS